MQIAQFFSSGDKHGLGYQLAGVLAGLVGEWAHLAAAASNSWALRAVRHVLGLALGRGLCVVEGKGSTFTFLG